MKAYLTEIRRELEQKGVSVEKIDFQELERKIIMARQSDIFHIEMDLMNQQKQECISQVHHAMNKYHYPGMSTDEINTIVANVLTHRAPTPKITDTVRLLISD